MLYVATELHKIRRCTEIVKGPVELCFFSVLEEAEPQSKQFPQNIRLQFLP